MAKRSLADQLDLLVEAILAGPGSPIPAADARLTPLRRVAAGLRGLPSQAFQKRLKADLAKPKLPVSEGEPAAPAVRPIREGFHTLTPYLSGPLELIDFVKRAFGGEELLRAPGSAGGLHCEVRIGDSIVMIGVGGKPMPTSLHLYVEDTDAVYRRALEAGATSTEKPVDQPYGDREAGVRDLSGNDWYIATHRATGLAPEGLRTVTPYLHARGAAEYVDFLDRALGAEEIDRATSPSGSILHAKVRIGDSILELGEAHGPYQPKPATFYLYVPDVDALYRRAVAAGAISQAAPSDQPYGDRVASVADPSGNIWHVATHVRDVVP